MTRFWYEDRDFPEIKAHNRNSPPDILAVVSNEIDKKKLIEEHNALVKSNSRLLYLAREVVKEYGWSGEHVRYTESDGVLITLVCGKDFKCSMCVLKDALND